MILILAGLLALQQDDLSRWIDKLGHEAIEEREAATRHLQELGPAAVERLEKAKDAARDPEIRARLGAIIDNIRMAAELAKVFGPTKRVTLSARRRKIEEALRDLEGKVEAAIASGKIDFDKVIDLELKNATWWEALDRAARAADARFEVRSFGPGRSELELVPGREIEFPTLYVEQFRIGVIEAKRIEFLAPGRSADAGFLVVEVRHQPNLKPIGRMFRDGVKIETLQDAKGEDARTERPGWAGGAHWTSRPLALQQDVWVRTDAAFPLTIQGTTDIRFAKKDKEVGIAFKGEGSEVKVGEILLKVSGFSQSKAGTALTLRAEAENSPDLSDCLVELVLEDSEGKRHRGMSRSSGGSNDYWSWDYDFQADIKEPKKIQVRWVIEFHRVELPFRLEGVRLP